MRKTLIALLVMVMVVTLCACSAPEKAVIGTWKSQTTILGVVTETTYTFNEDGTGTMANLVDVDFTYSFTEDKLLITTTTLGIKNTEEYSFEIKSDEMTLIAEEDTVHLERVD